MGGRDDERHWELFRWKDVFTILILVLVSSVPGGHSRGSTNHRAAPRASEFATCPMWVRVLQASCLPLCVEPPPPHLNWKSTVDIWPNRAFCAKQGALNTDVVLRKEGS